MSRLISYDYVFESSKVNLPPQRGLAPHRTWSLLLRCRDALSTVDGSFPIMWRPQTLPYSQDTCRVGMFLAPHLVDNVFNSNFHRFFFISLFFLCVCVFSFLFCLFVFGFCHTLRCNNDTFFKYLISLLACHLLGGREGT